MDGIISQTVEAVAGATYTFSGWTKFEGNYSGGVDTISPTGGPALLAPGQTSPTRTEIKLEFLDVNSVVIGSAVIDVEAARKVQQGARHRQRQHLASAHAPGCGARRNAVRAG